MSYDWSKPWGKTCFHYKSKQSPLCQNRSTIVWNWRKTNQMLMILCQYWTIGKSVWQQKDKSKFRSKVINNLQSFKIRIILQLATQIKMENRELIILLRKQPKNINQTAQLTNKQTDSEKQHQKRWLKRWIQQMTGCACIMT
jgi:hypothetical protein